MRGNTFLIFPHSTDTEMTANELRIGNWVTVLSSVPTQVSAYHLFMMVSYKPKDPIEANYQEITNPIPLTKEWLLKLGYTKSDDDFKAERSGNLYEKHIVYYSPEEDHDLHYVDESYGGIHEFHWKYFVGWDSLIQVTHVHQLQNLYYALTNKEL